MSGNNMSTDRKNISGKPLAWLLALIYFTSYMTRKNFAAVLQQVIDETGAEKQLLSVILVCMTVAYAIGQIINGRLGDKFKPTNMILCGLIITSAVNLLFPFVSVSVAAMAILWGINGFAQSMMWPPIVKILVSSCDDAMYGYSVVRVSCGSSFATIILYFIAPAVILLTGTWKWMLWICGALGVAAVVFWISVKNRIAQGEAESRGNVEKAPLKIPRTMIFPMVFIVFALIFQGMLRDGAATWMPTYLSDVHGMNNQISILSGVFPAVFSIVCFLISGALYRRFFTNEVTCAAVVFSLAVFAAGALFLLFGTNAAVAVVCFTLMTGCMHGVNLILVTHVPKRFKKYGNISTLAGIVNSCTYIGEAIFTYGFAALADHFDWRFGIGICFFIAICGTVCCLIAVRPWKKAAIDN